MEEKFIYDVLQTSLFSGTGQQSVLVMNAINPNF